MQFRTDMADERRDIYKKANKLEEINGIECNSEEISDGKITRVKVLNEEGEKALSKKKGNYITIDLRKISNLDEETKERIEDKISEELRNIINQYLAQEDEVLVVGLSNKYAPFTAKVDK